jgi:DNA-directed RNA polymerase subunit RPC12/RpoP
MAVMTGMGESYTCEQCGGEFTKTISDEEAAAEAEQLFPAADLEETGIVCDDCFRLIMTWAQESAPELLAEPSGPSIGDALHAEAEDARKEIRDAGIACPSCGLNMADLPGDHCLVLLTSVPVTRESGFGHPVALMGKTGHSCECRDGATVILTGADFGTWQAAASIQLWDDFRRRMDEVIRREIIGEGAGFTGTAGFLGQVN